MSKQAQPVKQHEQFWEDLKNQMLIMHEMLPQELYAQKQLLETASDAKRVGSRSYVLIRACEKVLDRKLKEAQMAAASMELEVQAQNEENCV